MDAANNGKLPFVDLNSILLHKTRLGACVLLAGETRMTFSKLKELLEETDGNLGSHLRKLEDCGYLSIQKEFNKRKPTTWYKLTPIGRQALLTHLKSMELIIDSIDVG